MYFFNKYIRKRSLIAENRAEPKVALLTLRTSTNQAQAWLSQEESSLNNLCSFWFDLFYTPTLQLLVNNPSLEPIHKKCPNNFRRYILFPLNSCFSKMDADSILGGNFIFQLKFFLIDYLWRWNSIWKISYNFNHKTDKHKCKKGLSPVRFGRLRWPKQHKVVSKIILLILKAIFL